MVMLGLMAWFTVGLLLAAASYLVDLARGAALDVSYLREHFMGAVIVVVAWPWALVALHQEYKRREKDGEL